MADDRAQPHRLLLVGGLILLLALAYGLITVASVFVLGSVFLAFAQIETDGFVASAARYAGASTVIVVLVVAAFVTRRPLLPRLETTVPDPCLVGAVVLVATSLVTARQYLPESVPAWLVVAGWFAVVGVVGALVLRWSRGRDWSDAHRLAAAGGRDGLGLRDLPVHRPIRRFAHDEP